MQEDINLNNKKLVDRKLAKIEAGDKKGMFYLDGFDFAGCDLRGVDFTEMSLKGTNFEGANLENACFINANIEYANFKDANLKNADLGGAKMCNTNFKDCKLKNVYMGITYTYENRKNNKKLYKTKIDPKSFIKSNENIEELGKSYLKSKHENCLESKKKYKNMIKKWEEDYKEWEEQHKDKKTKTSKEYSIKYKLLFFIFGVINIIVLFKIFYNI